MAARTLDCVQEKAVQLREKGKILYCLQLIADWNGDAYYWIVSHFEVLSLEDFSVRRTIWESEFFTRLKSAEYYEIYGSVSFSTGEKIKGENFAIVTILPEELGQKGEWLKEYAKKSLKEKDRLHSTDGYFFAALQKEGGDIQIVDLGV